MFRRSTKITSLIVAAASVVTMVPAMAADVKKVDSQDGTVYNAVAYKDGQIYIDGELEDKDEAAYYLANGKYTDLDDIDSGDNVNPYGDKYVEVDDGDYYLDLSTGKVTDDDVRGDAEDDAATALRKKVKKDNDGRYLEADEDKIFDTDTDASYVPTNKFGEVWFETSYRVDSPKADKNGGATEFTVYTDKSGNYIDADYNLGKINVINVSTDGSATLKNTNDDDDNVRGAIEHVKTIASDKDYIYRLGYLTVSYEGNDVTDTAEFGSKNKGIVVTTEAGADLTSGVAVGTDGKRETVTKVPVIQKISKAQDSDDVDGAKYAKTVNTYFVTGDDGKVEGLYDKFSVVDGKLVNYEYDGGKVYAKAITLKSKNGYYYTDISDGADCDVESSNAYGVGVDGTLYILDSGYVKTFDNDEDFDKIYKVDGSMDELSVYDKNNIVVWNEDDETYSIIAGKATEEDTTTDDAVTTGWAQDATTGAWSYVKADGTKAIGWFQSPTSQLWYYMDANGVMQANGWIQDGGSWYFLDSTGAMKTGWVYTGGAWYFLKNTAGNLGAMQTGWIQTGGKWYYCNASGAMLSNTTVGGYVLGADGAWIK